MKWSQVVSLSKSINSGFLRHRPPIMSETTQAFSFDELENATKSVAPPPDPLSLQASDGTTLAVRAYIPQAAPILAGLIFYHGGGAHSGAGYHLLAEGIKHQNNIAVYTPDIRGHGESGGPRGDAPSVDQIYRDINTVIDYVKSQHPDSMKWFLGGHSSGGGLVVNYSSWKDRKSVQGYLLVSPQLGYKSNTMRANDNFASVSIAKFILNGIFGILGNSKAVYFNYPSHVLEEDKGMVSWNTVNMANAITPQDPAVQMKNMNFPLGLWVGEDDELFDAEKVAAFAPKDGKVVNGSTHLGILVKAHELLGPWMKDKL